jgi:DNA-binding transcriptional LysR family regulator
MFDDLRQAVKNIEFIANPTVGEVRVGAHEPLIVGVLSAVFDHLHRKYPGISIHSTPIAQNAQQYRDLRERKIDLLLGRMTLPIQEDIHAEILFHDSIKIVAGPKNRWARQRKVELSELADEAWCLPPPESLIGSRIAEVFRARNIKFPPNGAARGGASLRLSPQRAFFRDYAGLDATVRRKSSAAHGPAGSTAD